MMSARTLKIIFFQKREWNLLHAVLLHESDRVYVHFLSINHPISCSRSMATCQESLARRLNRHQKEQHPSTRAKGRVRVSHPMISGAREPGPNVLLPLEQEPLNMGCVG